MPHRRWDLLPPLPPGQLVHNTGLSPLVLQLLYNRGIREPSQVKSFLAGDKSLLHDPFSLPDMPRAVSRIYRALLSGETIAVFGDYDADGITATALFVQGLSALGGKVIPYIPHRRNEGHGLSLPALKSLRQQGVSLVITVDCGITNFTEVRKAKKWGLDFVITDHHTPLSEIPDACAVVDPKLPEAGYPFQELSGVGVAFKVLQALLQNIGRGDLSEGVADLVAIGTIADLSPLTAENRYLVKEGLRLMNLNPRPGIRELALQAGIKPGSLDADKVSWIIAPCLNASGRMADASSGYRLMLTESPEEARELSSWLLEKNIERQKLTADTYARAREQVLAQGITPVLIISDDDFHMGIAGLVASRLTEEFYRPAIVIKTGKKVSQASCRSIPEFNIIAALTRFSELFTQFGGHSQAAGFTISTENLPRLSEQLQELAAAGLAGLDLRPHIDIDALVSLRDIGGNTYQQTRQLAPFGKGNPLPTFLSRQVEVLDCRTMGNGADHLRLKLRQQGAVWDAVAFNLGDCFSEVGSHLDIVYHQEVDSWGGVEKLRLCIRDFTASR